MTNFNNMNELDKYLKLILKDVIEAVARKVEDKVKANIDEYVYIESNAYYHNGTSQPTYEFRESWRASEPKPIVNGFQSEVASDPNRMTLDKDTFLHGSYWGDVREFLDEIINEGLSGNLFGSGFWTEKRPYFDKTIQDLVDGGLIDKWFRDEFRKRGISVK